MSIPKRVKDLGLVVDGRIRKGWPFRRFGGLRTPETSRSKGLLNPGVLCYRNAVLQCLLHNSEFFRYLSRQDRCATPGDNCVFCALRGLTIEYWTNTDSAARQQALDNVNTAMENHQQPGTTYGFLRRAGKKVNDMSISGQQDAHEYFLGLTNMLRHIKNDMNHGYNIRNVAINRLFNMRTRVTWVCEDCGENHVKRVKEVGINLAMPENPTESSLEWSLDKHYAPIINYGLRCYSDACNGKAGDREREFSIIGGPEILVIQIMRMRYNQEISDMEKVMNRIDYSEKLDLSLWSEGSLAYQLNGVISHDGESLTGGHYVATVRSQSGGRYARCNDLKIDDKSSKETILGNAENETWQSYLLVYQKIGGRMVNCI